MPGSGDARRIGPYEILGELGRGGMGVVHRARHAALGHEVALKVLGARPGAGSSAAGVPRTHAEGGPPALDIMAARFRREAQAAARLADHPGIVPVRDVGEDDGALWLAMELVEGRPLDALIAEGELTPHDAAALIEDVARAVHHAHTQGVLHRDLKPGNVLVEAAGGRPRVTDFGLAATRAADAELTRLTQAGELLGTPAYMAPEQARGTGVDVRADVYALGATLYEACAGSPPFAADSLYRVVAAVLRDPPPPLRTRAPETPPALAAIAERCLAKEPDGRYPTALALAEDLARFRRGERTEAEARRRRGRGGRRLAVGLAAAGAVALGLAAWRWAGQPAAPAAAPAPTPEARTAAMRDAWRALLAATVPTLRRLQDHAYGRPLDDADRDAALAALAAATARVAGAHPGTEAPAAIAALGRLYAGWRDADAVDAALASLRETGARDPLAAVVLAHALLVHYAETLRLPDVEFEATGDRVSDWNEPPALTRVRAEAATALQRARAELAGLPAGEALAAYAAAAERLGRGAHRDAMAALVALADDPLVGDEALGLGAVAALLAREPEAAAGAWERAAARGWVRACERAGLAWSWLASRALREGRDDGPALDAMRRASEAALAAWPDAPSLLSHLGNAHWKRAVHAHRTGGDPRAALAAATDAFQRALAADPGLTAPRLNLAGARRMLAEQEAPRGVDPVPRLLECVADLSAVLAWRPDYHGARRVRGDTWMSIARAQAARGVEPLEALAHAVEDFEAVIAADPQPAEAAQGLCAAWKLRADVEEGWQRDARASLRQAIAAADRACAAVPNDPGVRSDRADAWRRLGEAQRAAGEDPAEALARALADFDAVLHARPDHAAAWNNRALVHRALGDGAAAGVDPRPHYRASLADADRAVALRPDFHVARYNRAVAHDLLGDAAAALADFDQILAQAPHFWQGWLSRGHCHRRRGDLDAARRDYAQCLRVNPGVHDASRWLARLGGG